MTFERRHWFWAILLVMMGTDLLAQKPMSPPQQGTWFLHKGSLNHNSESRQGVFEAAPFKSRDTLAGYRGDLWFRLTIDKTELPDVMDLAVDLGRIGDADQTYWNGRLIGTTGLQADGIFYVPHLHRVYPIGQDFREKNTLVVHAVKTAVDSVGIGLDPSVVHFGAASSLQVEARRDYALRTLLPLLFGISFLLFGLYHLFLYVFLRSFPDYRDFGACLICFGVFGVCVSFWPFEMTMQSERVVYAHALGSIWALVFFGRYILGQGNFGYRIFHRAHYVLAAAFSIGVFSASTLEVAVRRYLYWYALFIPGVLAIFLAALLTRGNTRTRTTGLVGALAIMILALFHDVLVTLGIVSGDLWGIPVFLLILGVSTLVIGRDFSHAYLAVEQTVTSRTQELESANRQLRALEEMKARFFANISHDFKTPLAIALAGIEEAQQHGEKAEGGLDAAKRALGKLRTMIGDLLDTVKGESGTMKMDWQRVPVTLALYDWCRPYQVLCARKGLQLNIEGGAPESLKVPMDAGKMERVLANIISNAIKFTQHGSIAVRQRTDDTRLYIEIADSGPGVPASERAHIFDRYYQGSGTSLREHGGSGLGLAFAKEMVELQKGEIWVEETPGGGATFIIALPLTQEVTISSAYEAAVVKGGEPQPHEDVEVKYPPTVPELKVAEQPDLLVVEDNPEVAQAVGRALRGHYNVYFAPDGREACCVLEKQRFDCVIADIMMPQMSGTELLQWIRAQEQLRLLPVLVLTSLSAPEQVVRHLKLGAQDYVEKPFQRDVLLARVATQVETSRLRQEVAVRDGLAAIGTLTSGLCHEIRNPLNNISMASLRLTKGASAEACLEIFGVIERNVKRTDRLIQDLLKLSHTNSAEMKSQPLADIVAEALQFFVGDGKGRIAFRTEIPPGLQVLCHPDGLKQVLMTVVANGVQAIAQQGNIAIAAEEMGGRVRIAISDTGRGMSEEVRRRVFEPYFTTKHDVSATGMGLTIAQSIMQRNKGAIEIRSRENEGTTVILELLGGERKETQP